MSYSHQDVLRRQKQYIHNELAIALISNPAYPIPSAIDLLEEIKFQPQISTLHFPPPPSSSSTERLKASYFKAVEINNINYPMAARFALATREDFTLDHAIEFDLVKEFFSTHYITRKDISTPEKLNKVVETLRSMNFQEKKDFPLSIEWQQIFMEQIFDKYTFSDYSNLASYSYIPDRIIDLLAKKNPEVYLQISQNPNISTSAAIKMLDGAMKPPVRFVISNILRNPALPEVFIRSQLPRFDSFISDILKRKDLSEGLTLALWERTASFTSDNYYKNLLSCFAEAKSSPSEILSQIFNEILKKQQSSAANNDSFDRLAVALAKHPNATPELLRDLYSIQKNVPRSSLNSFLGNLVGNPAVPNDLLQEILTNSSSSYLWRACIFNPNIDHEIYLPTAWKKADYPTKAAMLLDSRIPLSPKHLENVRQFHNPLLDIALIQSKRLPMEILKDFLKPTRSIFAQGLALNILLQEKIEFLKSWQPRLGGEELHFLFEYLLDPQTNPQQAASLATVAFTPSYALPSPSPLLKQ